MEAMPTHTRSVDGHQDLLEFEDLGWPDRMPDVLGCQDIQ